MLALPRVYKDGKRKLILAIIATMTLIGLASFNFASASAVTPPAGSGHVTMDYGCDGKIGLVFWVYNDVAGSDPISFVMTDNLTHEVLTLGGGLDNIAYGEPQSAQIFMWFRVPYDVTVTGPGGYSERFNGTLTCADMPPAITAPRDVTATAGNAQASVSWTEPASLGGTSITGYTVTASPGGQTVTTTGATTATMTGLTNGTAYTFTVTAAMSGYGASPVSDPSAPVTPTASTGIPVVRIPVDRIAGSDRYATAIAASTQAYPTLGSAGAVVLARGDDYPDALVGTPLANAHNAPLLLTTGATLPGAVKTEIQRVVPAGGKVYLLGGNGAIPAGVDAQLTNLGFTPVRYAGVDRYATALAVAHALGDPSTVLLATGMNFPDALAAGTAAAHLGGAVLLTKGTAMATGDSAYLAAHPGKVYAVGGPAAAAHRSATPIVGADRYATAASVATRFFAAPTAVGVATGADFPDALSGSALLAGKDAPILLATAASLPTDSATYLTSVKSSVKTAYIFGGTAVVSAAVATAVATALR